VTDHQLDAEALAERRRRRLWLAGASTLLVAVLIGVAIAVSRSDDSIGTTTGKPEGSAETLALVKGIPQRDTFLGRAEAPVTIVEFADLQCPYCGQFARDVLPEVVRRYVRTGKVRLDLRLLTFLGPDSMQAAELAAAAALQGRLYQFVELVYRNQGEEKSGWVTDAYLRRIATASGLDVKRAFGDRRGPVAKGALAVAREHAKEADVPSTPWFLVERRGRPAEPLQFGAITVDSFSGALDKALGGQ
jgi:protein-disulfide isomerase